MAALLSSNIGKTEEVIKYIAEAREMQIEVLAPDVNESGWRFTVVGDKRVRFGLGAIRNVGRGAIDSLIAAHANVQVKDNDGSTALMHAAEAKKWDVASALIGANAHVQCTNANGFTALMLAAAPAWAAGGARAGTLACHFCGSRPEVRSPIDRREPVRYLSSAKIWRRRFGHLPTSRPYQHAWRFARHD